MNKMKGLASMESVTPYTVYEDPKIMFKHHSLMQDYEDLQKETQAMRERLEKKKKKKMMLKAEVGFLRRRYKYLMKNQTSNSQHEKRFLPPQPVESQGKKIMKEKNYGGKGTFLRQSAPVVDLSRKEKALNGKEDAFRKPIPVFDLNQKERTSSGKEAAIQNIAPVLDVNRIEKINGGTETPVRNATRVFDLNQISTEEEELQANYEPPNTEEVRKSSIRGGNDEQLKDIKMSICRNTGDGSSRAGKRKISWQDQVALRV